MVAAFILITGVVLLLVVGVISLFWTGNSRLLISLVPLAPWLVMVGTFLLMLTELLLLFGRKEDRQAGLRDLGYLAPTCLASGLLWYLAQHYLW